MRWLLRIMCAAVIAAGPTYPWPAAAGQDYPSRNVRVIVPYAAGGAGDILGRLLTNELQTQLGQSFYIDNRGGAGGILAATLAAQASADGYTLFEGATGPLGIAPFVHRSVEFDPIHSFAPVSLIAKTPYVLVVNPALPVKNVADLIALLKSKPGQLSFASAGAGGPDHLAGVMFTEMTHTQAVHVPYKGASLALVDVAAGRVQFQFVSPLPAMPMVASGQLRVIAMTSSERSPAMSDVPTVAETVPWFEVNPWYGILAPQGTPQAIVDRLHDAIAAAVANPNVRQHMIASGLDPSPSTPKEFADLIAADRAKWGAIVKKANIAATE